MSDKNEWDEAKKLAEQMSSPNAADVIKNSFKSAVPAAQGMFDAKGPTALDKVNAIKAITEEKFRMQQYIEAIAKHRNLKHTSITIHTELESQTFLVTDQYVQLILEDMDKFFQVKNLQLTGDAEALMQPRNQPANQKQP